MDIKKIKIGELEEFVNSEEYSNFVNIPISKARVYSYLNNPNSSRDDVVLYMALEGYRLIGYKTILADTFSLNHKRYKFGWLSGTWTHPDYRRQGVSLLLLDAVFGDWKENLMYTNYAEESKAVYDKTSKFSLLKSKVGYRHYLRFSFAELLPPKSIFFKKSISLLRLFDGALNFVFDVRFKFINTHRNDLYIVEKIDLWNYETNQFREKYRKEELFKRDEDIFNWIKKYPWVKNDSNTKRFSKKYYFTYYAKDFSSQWYKLNDKNSLRIIAVFMIQIKEGHLKMPYLYCVDNSIVLIKNELLKICINNNVKYMTLYDEDLNAIFLNLKYIKISSKKFIQNYFVTNNLLEKFPKIKNKETQSGDGDVVFT